MGMPGAPLRVHCSPDADDSARNMLGVSVGHGRVSVPDWSSFTCELDVVMAIYFGSAWCSAVPSADTGSATLVVSLPVAVVNATYVPALGAWFGVVVDCAPGGPGPLGSTPSSTSPAPEAPAFRSWDGCMPGGGHMYTIREMALCLGACWTSPHTVWPAAPVRPVSVGTFR